MTTPLMLPCDGCGATGENTTGDRHTFTNKDVCEKCGGKRMMEAKTGETPQTSYRCEPEVSELEQLRQEVVVLRRQRMAVERERELLEASNRHLEAERQISRAYVRLRSMIPGALQTPVAPSFEQVVQITEQALAVQLQAAKRPSLLSETGQAYIVALGQGGCVMTAGSYEGVPAVFVEPVPDARPPGTYAERQPGDSSLQPGSLIFTCSNHRSGEVLLTYVLRMLGKMEVEPKDDAEGFSIEAAVHYGFEERHDGNYIATNAQIIALVDAVRRQGQFDAAGPSFQDRNLTWMEKAFHDDPTDLIERRDRFAEEALEVMQAFKMPFQDVLQLALYVYNRTVGDPAQELGGLQVTAAGLATYAGLDLQECAEAELARVDTPEMLAKVAAKRASRKAGSVLPGDA